MLYNIVVPMICLISILCTVLYTSNTSKKVKKAILEKRKDLFKQNMEARVKESCEIHEDKMHDSCKGHTEQIQKIVVHPYVDC